MYDTRVLSLGLREASLRCAHPPPAAGQHPLLSRTDNGSRHLSPDTSKWFPIEARCVGSDCARAPASAARSHLPTGRSALPGTAAAPWPSHGAPRPWRRYPYARPPFRRAVAQGPYTEACPLPYAASGSEFPSPHSQPLEAIVSLNRNRGFSVVRPALDAGFRVSSRDALRHARVRPPGRSRADLRTKALLFPPTLQQSACSRAWFHGCTPSRENQHRSGY